MPNSYDPCDCGHNYSYHDPNNAPNLCRFADASVRDNNCGCQGFSVNGVLAGPGTNEIPNDLQSGNAND